MSANIGTSTPTRARGRPTRPLPKADRIAAQEQFLATFSETANISASCRKAQIDRATVYRWLEHDETFSVRFHLAEADAADVVRAAIHKRGILGWDEPVVSQGRVAIGPDGKPLMVRRYSDACLLALAKARVPEYRDKVDVNVQGGVAHEHRIIEEDPEAAGIARALIRRITSGGAS